MVATHEVEGHPRAISARTRHCVSKLASSPPNAFRRHHAEDAGLVERGEGLDGHPPLFLGGRRMLTKHWDQGRRPLDEVHREIVPRASSKVDPRR